VKRIVLPLLAVALVAATALRLPAQQQNDAGALKPVAVLSIASYDKIMADVAMFGNLAGNPDLDKNLEGMIKLFTQGQGLTGLDQKRPWCITLSTDGASFQPLAYLPVENVKQLLESLSGIIGEAEEKDGVFELNVFNQRILVKEKNKWAIVAMDEEVIKGAADDPAKLLAGLDASYDVGLRLYVQNIPEVYRSMAIDGLRQGVESGLTREPDESDEDYAARKKLTGSSVEILTNAINDIDQVTLGAAVDTSAKTAHIDLEISAVAGSKTAGQIGKMEPMPSEFAGFLVPDAAASLNVTTKIAKEDAEQIVSALGTIRASALEHVETDSHLSDESSKNLAKEMVNGLFDAIQATLESGKIDAGATLNLNDKALALSVGAYVAEPKSLEEALKKFAKLAEKDPNFPGIKFDADSHAGVRFHTATIPVPKDHDVAKVLGEKLDVALGIGEKSVYLALGKDSLAMTKDLIDKSKGASSKPLPPFQLNVSLEPIFKFAAAMQKEGEGDTVKAMAEELAKCNGKDKVTLVVKSDKSSMTIRLEAQEGVLRLLASAARLATEAGLPGAN
jgi:hypothetical protein